MTFDILHITLCCICFLFQKYYRLPEDGSYDEHAYHVFHKNAQTLVKDLMYGARVQVITQCMLKNEGRRLASKSEATEYGLQMTEEQFLEVNYRVIILLSREFCINILCLCAGVDPMDSG